MIIPLEVQENYEFWDDLLLERVSQYNSNIDLDTYLKKLKYQLKKLKSITWEYSMIKSKKDYKYYLEADRIALGKKRKKPTLFFDEVWVFQRLLRKVEYYKNCKNSIFYRPYYYYLYLKFHLLSIFLGFHIKPNVFGPGLSISHPGTIVVNGSARVGANCRIHVCTVIGTKAGYGDVTPKIGDNVYIGPGAKIFGDIEIADGIAIGANSVVNRSFTEPNIGIAGNPAKKINDRGSEKLLARATEILNNS